MRRVLWAAGSLAAMTSAALAGGLERSTQSVAPLFEPGEYVELSFGNFNPSVSGVLGPVRSGDMAESYQTFSFAYKRALSENVDVALIVDQPIGADVDYDQADPGYPFIGGTAKLRSTAVTGLLRYKFPSNVSIYGGLRAETAKGDVFIPVYGNYSLSTNRDQELGYVVGVAWEKPEIAARVALTYNSEITHSLKATEFGAPAPGFDTTVPQSVNLEFQTGVAKDTLVFGSIRWAEWSAFEIKPVVFSTLVAPGSALVSYDNDIVTYTLGVGRKFNEQWSGALILGYEKTIGDPVGNLGPTDGYRSIGVAATYKVNDHLKVTGGMRYVDIGNATTRGLGASFQDNSGVGAGLRLAYTF